MRPGDVKPQIVPLPGLRRHTYHYLMYASQFKAVALDTEVDISRLLERKERWKERGQRIGYVAFLIEAISRVLRDYPEANVSLKGGIRPKLAVFPEITAKFMMNKRVNGEQIVLSGIITESDQKQVDEIQGTINYFSQNEVEELQELKGVRLLQSLPVWLGRWMYRLAMGNLSKRNQLQGTFAISSLGQQPVQAFYPIISNTLCFGMGTAEQRPVVIDGQIAIRPIMKLSLVFDHRAIDGALAAEILGRVKRQVECIDAISMRE